MDAGAAAGFSITAGDYERAVLTTDSEQPSELALANIAQRRLEQDLADLLPALKQIESSEMSLHVRPLRSRMHLAMTMSVGAETLVIVDDAAHDLAHSLITLMFAAPPADPHDAGHQLRLPDAVRLARAELGSVRWNGSLWQPVHVQLPERVRETVSVVSRLALQFILAHEIGHGIPAARAQVHASRELESDIFAARVVTARAVLGADQAMAAGLAGLGRLAIRCALEISDLATDVFLVAKASHPPAAVRMHHIAQALGWAGEDSADWIARHFFQAVREMVTPSVRSIAEVVERVGELSWGETYEPDELAALDGLGAC